jgi:hypothetical protein
VLWGLLQPAFTALRTHCGLAAGLTEKVVPTY